MRMSKARAQRHAGHDHSVFSSSGFLSLERQEAIQARGVTGMSSNIVDFQSEVDKRRVPDDIEKTSDNQYVLELEHEILELQQQVCALHRDLERERGRGHTG